VWNLSTPPKGRSSGAFFRDLFIGDDPASNLRWLSGDECAMAIGESLITANAGLDLWVADEVRQCELVR
jgi:hypothetical protein